MNLDHVFFCNRPEKYHVTNKQGGHKMEIADHLRGKGLRAGYVLCRRSGLPPWCSARIALQYAR